MEPESPAVEAQSLNHWTSRKVPLAILHQIMHVIANILIFEIVLLYTFV